MARYHESLDAFEREFGDDRERGGGNRALQDQTGVVQREPRHDRIAQPTGADEGRQRCRSDTDRRAVTARTD